jgi:hypothetical protein
VNERGDHHRIDRELKVDQPAAALGKPQRGQVDDIHPVGQPDEEEERVNGE